MKIRTNNITQALTVYFSGVFMYSVALFIYTYNPYYDSFIIKHDVTLSYVGKSLFSVFNILFTIIGKNTYEVLIHLFIGYLVIGLFYFLFSKRADLQHNRSYVFLKGLVSFFLQLKKYFSNLGHSFSKPEIQVSKEEKITFLFFLVKFFFLPVMINFFFGNFTSLTTNIYNITHNASTSDLFVQHLYFCILNGLYLIDTLYFAFGYMFEFSSWKNKVRSVEPTFFGWFVALMCYPPFNTITGNYVSWGSSDYATFGSTFTTILVLCIVIFFHIVYVWATVSLGTKSSNLTNRGIVQTGAYAIVRHPAYISKNMAWFILGLPLIMNNGWALLSVLGWMFIYFLRAMTEEWHLMQDGEYREYCKKVRYRFIPYVF